MKNASATATNVGNLDVSQGEKTRIHEAAYGILMEMLSDIYANATEAVLREYSVNAWDEHRKHKVERPVEVTLPSVLQPTLVVRDFAAGLRADEVMRVFGEYGNSSKRDNNDEAGHFGIGSKAAFALGHQFIVTGYKDGQQFTALFTLNEDGTGTKTIVDEGPTDEPNGVKVSLGVEDVDAMNETAERFFSFWNRGEVLVNGEEPTPIFERLVKVSDEIYTEPAGRGEAYAVMGPVAYPVHRDLLRKVSTYLEKNDLGEAADLPVRLVDSDTDLYLRVPIGSVKPAPSRESLRDKASTVHTLGSVFLALHQESVVKARQEVANAPTYWEAAKALHRVNASLGAFKVNRKKVTWNGKNIPATLTFETPNFRLVTRSWRSSTMVLGQDYQISGVEFEQAFNWLTVVGVPEHQQGAVKRFAKRFLEENEEGITRILVTEADAVSFGPYQVGIEHGARWVTLDGWREMLRGMRKRAPRTVNEPSYTTGFESASRDLEDRDLLSDIINEGRDIVIFHDSARWLNKFQRAVLEDYTVVVLLGTQSENSLRKRIEEDGSVQVVEWATLGEQATAAAQAVLDGVTDAEKEALAARDWLAGKEYSRSQFTGALTALRSMGEVTSPSLLKVEEAYLLADEFSRIISEVRVNEIRQAERAVNRSFDVPPYEEELPDLGDLMPLLDLQAVARADNEIQQAWVKRKDGVSVMRISPWQNYRDNHARSCKYLHHVRAYVNSVN